MQLRRHASPTVAVAVFAWRVPQNTDPRTAFRDYAQALSVFADPDDCTKLVLLIKKAGELWIGSGTPEQQDANSSKFINGLLAGLTEYSSISLSGRTDSDPNYRVGVFTRDSHYGGGFRDSGFIKGFQDRSNQVRHFIAYLASGFSLGIPAADAALYYNENTTNSAVPDVGLGEKAASLGGNFFGDSQKLAQDVYHEVCGKSGAPKFP